MDGETLDAQKAKTSPSWAGRKHVGNLQKFQEIFSTIMVRIKISPNNQPQNLVQSLEDVKDISNQFQKTSYVLEALVFILTMVLICIEEKQQKKPKKKNLRKIKISIRIVDLKLNKSHSGGGTTQRMLWTTCFITALCVALLMHAETEYKLETFSTSARLFQENSLVKYAQNNSR